MTVLTIVKNDVANFKTLFNKCIFKLFAIFFVRYVLEKGKFLIEVFGIMFALMGHMHAPYHFTLVTHENVEAFGSGNIQSMVYGRSAAPEIDEALRRFVQAAFRCKDSHCGSFLTIVTV